MAGIKSDIRAAIEIVVERFPFQTDCMSDVSTAKRCKRHGGYSESDIIRIREITTRLEEIRLLLVVYELRHGSNFNPASYLPDRLQDRARELRAENIALRIEAETITDEPLVSKVQATANRDASGWYAVDEH